MRRTVACVCLFAFALAAGARLEVTDDLGRQVTLEAPAKRIVSLSPHITEMLFELGAGERIVGTVRFSDHPPAARDIPRVGDAFSINVETIVNMKPDLVIAWATGGAGRTLERLRSLGIPVYVNRVHSLESIAGNLQAMARLAGKAVRGDALAERYLEELDEIRRSVRDTGSTKVFFQISDQDLYTVNGSHLIGEAIELCGGSNPFGDSPVPVPRVSKEAVLAAEPDVIIISQPVKSRPSPWIEKWQQYEFLKGKIQTIDPDLISRPSLRMLEGVRSLCGIIGTR